MPADDVTLHALEQIEEAASAAIGHPAQPEGTDVAVREGEPATTRAPMDEIASYKGDQVNSEIIFAHEGMNLTRSVR